MYCYKILCPFAKNDLNICSKIMILMPYSPFFYCIIREITLYFFISKMAKKMFFTMFIFKDFFRMINYCYLTIFFHAKIIWFQIREPRDTYGLWTMSHEAEGNQKPDLGCGFIRCIRYLSKVLSPECL